jgi:nucleotide-binding universal stress UspA family protein
LAEAGLEVHGEVIEATAGDGIIEYTRRHPEIDMVAMATHGRTGLRRLFMGSVAEHVLHATTMPVLLVRPDAEAPVDLEALPSYKRVVVPLDGSPFAERALSQAKYLASYASAEVVLVAVAAEAFERVQDKEAWHKKDWNPAPWETDAGLLMAYLRDMANTIHEWELPVQVEVATGDPSEAIIGIAREVSADIVVMATHARAGLSRLLSGSVAMSVVCHTNKPVLLVHPSIHTIPTLLPVERARLKALREARD